MQPKTQHKEFENLTFTPPPEKKHLNKQCKVLDNYIFTPIPEEMQIKKQCKKVLHNLNFTTQNITYLYSNSKGNATTTKKT